jgi:hypothetical protein
MDRVEKVALQRAGKRGKRSGQRDDREGWTKEPAKTSGGGHQPHEAALRAAGELNRLGGSVDVVKVE